MIFFAGILIDGEILSGLVTKLCYDKLNPCTRNDVSRRSASFGPQVIPVYPAYISTLTIPVPTSITSFQVQHVKSASDESSEWLDATGEHYKCYP